MKPMRLSVTRNTAHKKETVIKALFIIFTFAVAGLVPFYWGALLIIAHKTHEIYFGECYFTLLQKEYGYSEADEDFFYHLLVNKLNFNFSHTFTQNIHLAIKTIVLIIVLINAYYYFN